jgi:hypothetical protein
MAAENASGTPRLYRLVLLDGRPKIGDPEDPEDPSFFISEVRTSDRYKGLVDVIDVRQSNETVTSDSN